MLKSVDKRARGRGLSMAQIKVTRANGTVEYHLSKPRLRPWDVIGRLWAFAHARDLKRLREKP